MNDPVFIDANCFADKSFIFWLKSYHGRKMISSIVYAELCYHYVMNKGKNIGDLDRLLDMANIKIERLEKKHVGQAIRCVRECNDKIPWKDNAFDYLIAGHILSHPTKLITQNIKDFSYLDEYVLDMDEFRKLVGN